MFPKESFSVMQASNAAANSPKGARRNQKVEVAFERHAGIECVALKYFTWTEGLGWCCQKMIRVDGYQLDELHRAITIARHCVRRQRADDCVPYAPPQDIQSPSPS